jgi:hypothetical protein
MLTYTNADVAGAGEPECFTNDKARVRRAESKDERKKQSRHSRACGLVHQALQVMAEAARDQSGNVATLPGASSGNVATREARCLSIRRSLRRIGHTLLARDDGMWIVRAGAV